VRCLRVHGSTVPLRWALSGGPPPVVSRLGDPLGRHVLPETREGENAEILQNQKKIMKLSLRVAHLPPRLGCGSEASLMHLCWGLLGSLWGVSWKQSWSLFGTLGSRLKSTWGLFLGLFWGLSGGSLEPAGGLGGPLGRRARTVTLNSPSWAPLGASWAALGPSWAPLGALLGCLGALLGACWVVMGRSWGPLGPSWPLRDQQNESAKNVRFLIGMRRFVPRRAIVFFLNGLACSQQRSS